MDWRSGEIDLAGAISGNAVLTADAAMCLGGVGGITKIDGVYLNSAKSLTFTSATESTGSSFTANGVVLSFPVLTTLTNVNLYASSGGEILFPAATAYNDRSYGNYTIQASGTGSKIDLSHLESMAGE